MKRKGKDFGNTRWVKQLVGNGILPAMARRIMASGQPMNMELCSQIEPEDMWNVQKTYMSEPTQKKQIGFVS